MKYKIIGTDRRYSMKRCYGEFDNLKDAVNHMNSLCISFGNIIKFKII